MAALALPFSGRWNVQSEYLLWGVLTEPRNNETTVNANWLSRDLVLKNAVGEKTIIKKGTIRLKKFTVNEKYKIIKKEATKRLAKYDYEINRHQKYIKREKAFYAECFIRPHPEHKLKSYGSVQRICDKNYYYLKKIKYYESEIEQQKSLKKSYLDKVEPTLLKYKNWNGTGNEVISTTIYYTPIFEGINKIKTVGYQDSVVCDNQFVNFSSLGIYAKTQSSSKRKICKRYAKF